MKVTALHRVSRMDPAANVRTARNLLAVQQDLGRGPGQDFLAPAASGFKLPRALSAL